MKETGVVKNLRGMLQDHPATFSHPFSPDPIPFLQSQDYQKLTEKDLAFDIYTIPWLNRDHGEIVWPPETE
jgi:hypothetical protein